MTADHPEIDWKGIVGLRNVLVHDYLGVNLERTFNRAAGTIFLIVAILHALRLLFRWHANIGGGGGTREIRVSFDPAELGDWTDALEITDNVII